MFPTFQQVKARWPDVQDNPRRLSLEVWEEILTALGFERWEVGEGVTLDNLVRQRYEKKDLERWKPGQARMKPRTHPVNPSRVEIWQHPLGVLAGLDLYKSTFRDEWSFNHINFLAIQDLGLKQAEKSLLEGYAQATPDGTQVSSIKWSAHSSDDGAQSFALFCDVLERARSSGALLPPSQWKHHADILKMVFGTYASKWFSLRGDWSDIAFQVPKETYPIKQSETVRRLVDQRLPALKKLVETSLHPLHGADVLKDVWLESRRRPGGKWKASTKEAMQSVAELHERRRSQELVFALIGLMMDDRLESSDRLSPDQRTVVEAWNLSAGASVSVDMALKNLPATFPGIPDWTVLDAWLLFPMQPGIWPKIEAQIASLSNEELAVLCQPRGSVAPLALALATGLAEMDEHNHQDAELKGSKEGALACLETLHYRLGSDAFVWEGQKDNLWGRAMNIASSLAPDIVENQQERFMALFRWAREKGLALPATARWNNDGMDFERSLLNGQHIDGLPAHLNFLPEAHWELLRPARAELRQEALEQQLPSVSASRRPRM